MCEIQIRDVNSSCTRTRSMKYSDDLLADAHSSNYKPISRFPKKTKDKVMLYNTLIESFEPISNTTIVAT